MSYTTTENELSHATKEREGAREGDAVALDGSKGKTHGSR